MQALMGGPLGICAHIQFLPCNVPQGTSPCFTLFYDEMKRGHGSPPLEGLYCYHQHCILILLCACHHSEVNDSMENEKNHVIIVAMASQDFDHEGSLVFTNCKPNRTSNLVRLFYDYKMSWFQFHYGICVRYLPLFLLLFFGTTFSPILLFFSSYSDQFYILDISFHYLVQYEFASDTGT